MLNNMNKDCNVILIEDYEHYTLYQAVSLLNEKGYLVKHYGIDYSKETGEFEFYIEFKQHYDFKFLPSFFRITNYSFYNRKPTTNYRTLLNKSSESEQLNCGYKEFDISFGVEILFEWAKTLLYRNSSMSVYKQ